MRTSQLTAFTLLTLATTALTGCRDQPTTPAPVAPTPPTTETPSTERGTPEMALLCSANIQHSTLQCHAPPEGESTNRSSDAADAAASKNLILGGQDEYVRVEATNVSFDSTTRLYSADLSLTNLTTQAFAMSAEGLEDPAGVRLFIHRGPTRGVTLTNPDGAATFTAASEPYLQYDGLLLPDSTSAEKTWTFSVPDSVTEFQFTLFVSTKLPHPERDLHQPPYIDFYHLRVSSGGGACYLLANGIAQCRGFNAKGELGDGTTTPVVRWTYAPITGDHQWIQLSSGYDFSCGLDSAGVAYCWGSNYMNALGTGDTTSTFLATPTPGRQNTNMDPT